MTFGFLNHSQVDSKISNFFQKNFWQQILLDSTGNSLYRGKQMLPHVQLSINFRIGWCFAEKYLPYSKVNFAHACLISTALGEPSYYPCKKIFLDSTPTQKNVVWIPTPNPDSRESRESRKFWFLFYLFFYCFTL